MRAETHVRVPVRGPQDVQPAAGVVADVADRSGLDEACRDGAVFGATELAANLALHAGPGGYLLARTLRAGPHPGIELISVDSGPGISDVARASSRPVGGSTSGLEAVRRTADAFDIWSLPRQGTAVLARYGTGPSANGRLEVGAVSVALSPQEGSGDRWAVRKSARGTSVMVVDGLGHGRWAAEAAEAALSVFESWTAGDGTREFVLAADRAMRGTRGGVLTVCHVSPEEETIYVAGLGNVTARLLTPSGERGLPVESGIAGTSSRPPPVDRHAAPFPAGSTLVMYSDGLEPGVNLEIVARMPGRDPSLVAAMLHRDHGRSEDDSTVLVVADHPALAS